MRVFTEFLGRTYEIADKLTVGSSSRCNDLPSRRIRFAIGNVLGYRTREEDRLLTDNTNLAP
jgi:hypothetical protein